MSWSGEHFLVQCQGHLEEDISAYAAAHNAPQCLLKYSLLFHHTYASFSIPLNLLEVHFSLLHST